MKDLDAEVAALAHDMPPPAAGSNRTYMGRRGARLTCAADAAAITTYREALKSYDARLASLTGQRSALQARLGLGLMRARLVEESEAAKKEADELEQFAQRKFGSNDNARS